VARKFRLGRLLSHAGRAAAEAASTRAGKARERLTRPYTCNCGWHGRTYRSMNAHHLGRHGGYWGGRAGKAMGRKVGKVQDAARRHARGWQESHGLVDRMGRSTHKGRTREQVRGGPREATRGLRQAHKFDRDHHRAEKRERKAETAAARGRHARAARHRDKAAFLRGRHSEDGGHNMIPRSHPAHPSRAPQPARQPRSAGKTRTAPEPARTQPARTPPAFRPRTATQTRAPRTAPARPAPARATPASNGNGNGARTAPNGTRPARTPR